MRRVLLTVVAQDRIPIGVLVQTKEKPEPRYRVLGLGLVTADSDSVFTIQQFGSAAQLAEDIAVHLPPNAFDAGDSTDARECQPSEHTSPEKLYLQRGVE